MKNSVDFLIPTKAKDVTKTSSVSTESKKESPSLFDSMLNGLDNAKEKKVETKQPQTNSSTKNLTQSSSETKEVNSEDLEDIKEEAKTTEVKKESNVKDSGVVKEEIKDEGDIKISLLDKLVQESQKIIDDGDIEPKVAQNTQVGKESLVDSKVAVEDVKNPEAAKELNKIAVQSEEDKSSEVKITNKEVERLINSEDLEEVKKDSGKLIDRLVSNSTKIYDTTDTSKEILPTNLDENKSNLQTSKDTLVTNMYLSSQNKSLNDASIVQKTSGVNTAKNATKIADIEKSADILDLNMESSELSQEAAEFKLDTKLNFLNKLAFAQTILKKEYQNMNQITADTQSLSAATIDASIDDGITNELPATNLNLSQSAIYSIENRIVGARQQLSSMMSDVARNMYENYKPPVTAFRINLNPAHLGNIAIIMKNDNKDNGINISLTLSNSSTMDAFLDNQTELRNALGKNFSEGTNFSLNFSMQDSNSNQNMNQSSNNSYSNSEDREINNDLDEQVEEKKATTSQYM